ncbi:MAG: hypothetical protein RJA07_1411 [Bacteroidota bacterium]|jgi:hypothetical protein
MQQNTYSNIIVENLGKLQFPIFFDINLILLILSMLHDYYKILGVSEQATIEQINKAYRTKAKQLHPDINPHPNAHQQFVLLNEAFEFIKNNKQNNTKSTDENFTNWWQNEKQKANERAEQQARMRYKEYINSDEYRYLNSLNILLDHVGFLFTLIVPVLLPLMFYKWYGINALVPAAILLVFASPYVIEGWGLRKKINFKRLRLSIFYLVRFDDFKLIWLTILNVWLFWNYTLVTMINLKFILLIYLLALIICLLLWYFKFKNKIKLSLIVLLIGISPFIANSVFIINYYISFNTKEEKYEFVLQRGAIIKLENDAYDEFTFIRFFPDPDRIGGNRFIKLTFANGIYGWRVLKDYELIK